MQSVWVTIFKRKKEKEKKFTQSNPNMVGRGSEQPGLAEDVPAHHRGVGLDDL